jgi:peptidoglycan hydrolase CwlO-like protein
MGKHRELAKELYSSRIWRTVVFAGAMLGTPAASADVAAPKPPTTQPANPPAKPTGSGGAAAGAPAIVAAPPKADPITQKSQALDAANKERDDLIAKLSSVDVKEIDKTKKELDAKDAQIKKLVTDLVNLRKPRPRTPPEVRPVGRGFVLA